MCRKKSERNFKPHKHPDNKGEHLTSNRKGGKNVTNNLFIVESGLSLHRTPSHSSRASTEQSFQDQTVSIFHIIKNYCFLFSCAFFSSFLVRLFFASSTTPNPKSSAHCDFAPGTCEWEEESFLFWCPRRPIQTWHNCLFLSRRHLLSSSTTRQTLPVREFFSKWVVKFHPGRGPRSALSTASTTLYRPSKSLEA